MLQPTSVFSARSVTAICLPLFTGFSELSETFAKITTMEIQYHYELLPTASSIRLLRLSFGADNEQILSEITDFELADAPPYTATSYFWGDPTPTRQVYIVDSDGAKQGHLGVHENLWHLLRNVCIQQQAQGEQRAYFWTDCLSLNQSNKDEVSQQVARMGEIYSSAGKVLVWLGHEEKLAQALGTLNAWPERKHCSSCEGVVITTTTSEAIKAVSSAINGLLALPYWRRVWIVQEVVLAKAISVMVGQATVDFDDFCNKVDFFATEYRVHTAQAERHGIRTLCDMRAQPNYKFGLGELLKDHLDRECTQTIDVVYGFLGLVAQTENEASSTGFIEANVEKTPSEVLWDVIFACQVSFQSLVSDHMLDSLNTKLGHHVLAGFGANQPNIAEYIDQKRTSSVSRERAGYALRTLEAMSGWYVLVSYQYKWSGLKDEIYKVLYSHEATMTDLQRTAAVGLVIFQWSLYLRSSWESWTCMFHHAPSQSGCQLSSKGFFARTVIMAECATLRDMPSVMHCALEDDHCDKSIMACTIDAIGFQLLVWQTDELSENEAYASLALSYNPKLL
jgi:hypothetical protein